MAEMKISNTLVNDTSDKVIAYAEQLKQNIINWAEYTHVTEKLGQDRPDIQSQLNSLFLSVYEQFLTFLNDADATDRAIDTWKEIEDFLAGYTDDKTLAGIVAQLNANIESRLNVQLANETGQSTTNGMTQKAITDEFANVEDMYGKYVDNPEYVEVHTDAEDKILYGVKSDGDFHFGAGVPSQIQEALDTVESTLDEAKVDKVAGKQLSTEDYSTAEKAKLTALPTNAELTDLLDEKVDKEEGQSLIDADFASSQSTTESPEYLQVTLDQEDKILEGIKTDGTKVIGADTEIGGSATISGDATVLGNVNLAGTEYKVVESPEWIKVIVDAEDKILCGIRQDGKFVAAAGIEGVDLSEIEETLNSLDERVTAIETDNSNKLNTFHYNPAAGQESYIVSPFNSENNIKNIFKVQEIADSTHNPVFKYISVKLVNKTTKTETLVHDCSDDITPASYNNTYIGGNHGDSDVRKIVCTSPHGKNFVDIGSIWSDGTNQCTLIGIVDSNTLLFIGENKRSYPLFTFNTSMFSSDVTLTHVSGATSTTNITIESSEVYQWKPCCIANRDVFIDDVKLTEGGDYSFNNLKICEYYDVLNVASVLNIIQSNVGSFTKNPVPSDFESADKVVRHSIVYEFDSASDIKVATSFIAYQNIAISYFGFAQQMALAGHIKMYIPKALPISNGRETVDFRTIVPYDSVPQTMELTSPYWEDATLPPDRWMQISNNIALHCGFLFDYGVGGNNRKDNIYKAFFLYTSRKIYPYGIDSKVTVNAGDSFSAVTWRCYKDISQIDTNGIISINTFEYNDHLYLYGDFNAEGIYTLEIPSKYVGKEISVFEKRSNVKLLDSISNKNILIQVSSAFPMYGYIVAKI